MTDVRLSPRSAVPATAPTPTSVGTVTLVGAGPGGSDLIAAGNSKGGGMSQDDINDLLVEHALAGANVVRLEGGDPFVFGRGSEEIDALASVGVGCEVIPGVSSALAAPALAGIPLTERSAAASFTVLTGHRGR